MAEPLNQEIQSDLDAQRIIHLEMNVAQHDNKGNLLTFAVKLDDFNITSSPPLKIRSVTGQITSCLIELHDHLMNADGYTSVLDAVIAPITHDLVLGKPGFLRITLIDNDPDLTDAGRN